MAETQPARPKLSPRRVLGWAALSVAVAIAITIFASNAGLLGLAKAGDCKPQPLAAQVVDAAATGQLAALNGTGTGRGYSGLAFEDANGKPMTLEDFAGKALLVNFWASWCIPCRAEMPALNELAAQANGDNFMVLPINLDIGAGGLEKAKKFLAEGNWPNLPLYADPSFESFKKLQLEAVAMGLPSTLLIDKNGCEIGVLQGPAEWNTPDGLRVIDALEIDMTILCVGALALDTIFLLDELPKGPGKFLPRETLEVAQGMATAQAATIVRLGGSARLWASHGDDEIGRRIVDQLVEAGIDISALRKVPGARSGFSSILMDPTGERIIVPHYDTALRAAPDTAPLMDGIDLVSVDVRWPEAALAALGAAHDLGLPGLADIDIGPRETLLPLFHNASHAIASEGGAKILTGEPTGFDAIKMMAREHPGFVAVTLGELGSYFADRKAGVLRHVPAFPVKAVDTLAAGDVFHGAFALRLAEGADEADAMRFASAAAALKCTRFGGRLGAPTRAEVEALVAA